MTPREKFINTIRCSNYDIPVFCPAIYDYKVNFSNSEIHIFGQDKDEFISAVKKEIDALRSEVTTCGYDIYNVEAEALGSDIARDIENIFPEVTRPLISQLEDVRELPVLEEPRGRMPLFIEVTETLRDQYKEEVYIRGAVSGPFSLAGRIYDKESLLLDSILNPQGVIELLDYCTKVIITYLKGFFDKKLDVVLFDSLASPPLVSPEIYRNIIFPFHKNIFDFMLNNGVEIRPLIMGGNTCSIMDYLYNTGANQLLLDHNIPFEDVEQVLGNYDIAFRVNIDPDLLSGSNQVEIVDYLQKMIDVVGFKPNLLIGTGILMRNVPLENIQFTKEFLKVAYQNILNENVKFR